MSDAVVMSDFLTTRLRVVWKHASFLLRISAISSLISRLISFQSSYVRSSIIMLMVFLVCTPTPSTTIDAFVPFGSAMASFPRSAVSTPIYLRRARNNRCANVVPSGVTNFIHHQKCRDFNDDHCVNVENMSIFHDKTLKDSGLKLKMKIAVFVLLFSPRWALPSDTYSMSS
jgi:hypothetical protein